nr:MAG TPA: Repressor protein CI [Caudoviricetes sp.]
MNQEFNMRLKKAMNIRAITQSELCEKTGIPKSAMSQYISGNFKPKQNRTHSLAKALDVNEAWLMGYDVPMERQSISEQDNNQNKNIVAINLKKIRADKMLRYADISALSGVPKEDLQAFEEGTKRPKSADIRNIELALDIEKGTLKGKKQYIPTGPDESIPTKPNEIVVDNKHIILSPEEYKKLNEFLGRSVREKNEKYIALKKETTELLEKIIDLIYENKISEEKLKSLNENLKRISENND